MRYKIPVYATHALVPTPDGSYYKTIYVLATDGVTYAKNSAGVSGALIGGAVAGAVAIGATLDASPPNTPYPAATKGAIRVISAAGSVGDGNPLNPGVVVDSKDYLLCIQDSLGGDQTAAGADWVVIVPTERVTSIAEVESRISTVEEVNDDAVITVPLSLGFKNHKLNANVGGVGTRQYSLADGTEGQIKKIVLVSGGGPPNAAVITPANIFGVGTTIVFSQDGDYIELLFINGAWYPLSKTATLV